MDAKLGMLDRITWRARVAWTRRRHPELVETDMQTALGLKFAPVAGRTLPEGLQWCGKDNPGGAAATRRRRQQARLSAKTALDHLRQRTT